MYVNRFDAQIIETEDESGYVQQMHEPKMPVVIAEHKHNKWGSPRGYKVHTQGVGQQVLGGQQVG